MVLHESLINTLINSYYKPYPIWTNMYLHELYFTVSNPRANRNHVQQGPTLPHKIYIYFFSCNSSSRSPPVRPSVTRLKVLWPACFATFDIAKLQLCSSATQTSWMDQLDQFSLFEALASRHIWRLTFQFVHCPTKALIFFTCTCTINICFR